MARRWWPRDPASAFISTTASSAGGSNSARFKGAPALRPGKGGTLSGSLRSWTRFNGAPTSRSGRVGAMDLRRLGLAQLQWSPGLTTREGPKHSCDQRPGTTFNGAPALRSGKVNARRHRRGKDKGTTGRIHLSRKPSGRARGDGGGEVQEGKAMANDRRWRWWSGPRRLSATPEPAAARSGRPSR
jgi:hypothetical protein